MAMLFDGLDRPNRNLERKINEGITPYNGVLFSGKNDFQSILATRRYKQVVEKVRRHNFLEKPIQNSLSEISHKMGMAINDVLRIEAPHKKRLQKLAIDLVCHEMGIPKGSIDFDAEIVGVSEMNGDDFNKNQTDELSESAKKFDKDRFILERNKRRLINSLIQGAAKRGHYMYQLVEEELNEIVGTKELVSAYNIMMSTNDTFYWQIDDITMNDMIHNSKPVGKCFVELPDEYDDNEEVNPKIIVRAITFPVLVHELVKGVIELFSYHGHPEDEKMFEEVLNLEDTLSKEIWDLRLGPALWDMLREQFPAEILIEESEIELQNYLLVEIFRLPSEDFIELIEDVINNNGHKKLLKMTNNIKLSIASDNYEKMMRNYGMWDDE